ncbi:molybdenum cofactor sulfurase [Desulfolithobacter dissulfuricans]|uniref:Molybdenum cofactor sulfurase n=1 Tax=Desulfolithobacter dissulfuricans TaxID=2795293 RepID=A0A915XJG7_9BACT|nr:MOSC domain-containing protein [Desulfolithobacter dissulfuricans]BCO10849.1 molybdenum cofactor sulfurase [Desulfolithobacter dissulfuricans]
MGKIVSLNISSKKGVNKEPVEAVELRVDHGIEGDAHAGKWHRQVSLLAQEAIDFMRAKGLELEPGAFAENITTEGIDLARLPVGTRLRAGEVELEVTQIGKKCHKGCAIFQQVGDCIMPREGIFAKVIVPGTLRTGDTLEVV